MEQYFTTRTVEILLTVGVPLTIAVFFFAVNLFGATKVAEQGRKFWRVFFPLVNEPSDPAIMALALVLKQYSTDQLVEFFKKYNDQIDPAAESRQYAQRISQKIEQETQRRGIKPDTVK